MFGRKGQEYRFPRIEVATIRSGLCSRESAATYSGLDQFATECRSAPIMNKASLPSFDATIAGSPSLAEAATSPNSRGKSTDDIQGGGSEGLAPTSACDWPSSDRAIGECSS